jgi:hypothetical protein
LACHYTWPKCWTEIVYLTGNHYKNWNLLGYLLGYPSEILYQPPKRGTHLEAREFILSQREFNTKKKLGFVQCSQSLCTEPGPNFLVVNGPWGISKIQLGRTMVIAYLRLLGCNPDGNYLPTTKHTRYIWMYGI